MPNSKYIETYFDWILLSVVILTFSFLIFIVYQKISTNSTVKKPEKINRWKKLVDRSSFSVGRKTSVQLIEFYSYSCGFCNILHHHLNTIEKKYHSKVSFSYKPIYHHVLGRDYYAAIAAECARLQHKFNDYNDLLFEDETNYNRIASQIGIDDRGKFSKCVKNKTTKRIVVENQLEADTLGIKGVPFLIINGNAYQGALSVKSLDEIINNQIEK